ncbi:A24 family peptidase [Texcoconibacillus texcoconensis]|uniref:Prepilin peptidase CpaA n=1 Tax=Texcoconibacillus texcoconensis TaxID=1095777 RepID=A0A840QQ90_9BACI|nr:prepilin peptidase [Texcoconibacillus texcoconensis]MBB5173477.1 prepilin peptidase CpaA [Texcoconibacillus texcoconensis]
MLDVVLIILLVTSVFTDLMYRKIFNFITFPTTLFGFTYHIWESGVDGLLFSGFGFIVGLIVLFVPFFLGGIGAGDVKLLAAIGTLKGASFVFYAFIYTCIAGGMIAMIYLLKSTRIKQVIARMISVLTLKTESSIKKNAEQYKQQTFPYGVAIFIGTLCSYWLGGG